MNEILKKRIEESGIEGSKHYDQNVSKFRQWKQVGYIRGFNEGATFALSHQWISVDEALPDYDVPVLVVDKAGEENFGTYFNHRSNNPDVKTYTNGFCDLFGEGGEVVAWMPIPKFETKGKDKEDGQ